MKSAFRFTLVVLCFCVNLFAYAGEGWVDISDPTTIRHYSVFNSSDSESPPPENAGSYGGQQDKFKDVMLTEVIKEGPNNSPRIEIREVRFLCNAQLRYVHQMWIRDELSTQYYVFPSAKTYPEEYEDEGTPKFVSSLVEQKIMTDVCRTNDT